MIGRDELRAIFAEDDRQRVLHAEWTAQRTAVIAERDQEQEGDRCPASSPLVAKSDAGALMYRVHENNASLPATYHEPEAVYAEPSGEDELVDALVIHSRALGDAVLDLRRENDKLKAQLDLVLQLIGSKNTDDDRVVDLPRGFIRRRNDAA
jgi:hypothetical protein